MTLRKFRQPDTHIYQYDDSDDVLLVKQIGADPGIVTCTLKPTDRMAGQGIADAFHFLCYAEFDARDGSHILLPITIATVNVYPDQNNIHSLLKGRKVGSIGDVFFDSVRLMTTRMTPGVRRYFGIPEKPFQEVENDHAARTA